jgi:hypothetical protein
MQVGVKQNVKKAECFKITLDNQHSIVYKYKYNIEAI